MEQLFKLFLYLHIATGTLGLLAGSFIMYAKKGDQLHKRIGRFFAYSMLAAGFSSFVLAVIHPNEFLFTVGVFTIFLVGTGWRYLYLRNIPEGQQPLLIDWVLMGFMSIFGIVFIGLGIWYLAHAAYFGIVPILFGLTGLRFALTDYRTFTGKITIKNYWLVNHLQRMSGAYIASLTAFLVVNAPSWSGIIPWLLPSAIIVPLIVSWTRKYRLRNGTEIKAPFDPPFWR